MMPLKQHVHNAAAVGTMLDDIEILPDGADQLTGANGFRWIDLFEVTRWQRPVAIDGTPVVGEQVFPVARRQCIEQAIDDLCGEGRCLEAARPDIFVKEQTTARLQCCAALPK